MKKLICILLLVVLAFGAYMFITDKSIDILPYESEIYTDEEIKEAIAEAKRYFRHEFEGCTLLTITYLGDDSVESHQEFADRKGADDVLVLVSSFYVSPNGGDGSLSQNDIYTGWKWIMVRGSDGKWQHADHGYA